MDPKLPPAPNSLQPQHRSNSLQPPTSGDFPPFKPVQAPHYDSSDDGSGTVVTALHNAEQATTSALAPKQTRTAHHRAPRPVPNTISPVKTDSWLNKALNRDTLHQNSTHLLLPFQNLAGT